MPMVVESTFELEFVCIAAAMTDFKVQIWQPSELHSFYYKKNSFLCLWLFFKRRPKIHKIAF
jgi:hypothetical protein